MSTAPKFSKEYFLQKAKERALDKSFGSNQSNTSNDNNTSPTTHIYHPSLQSQTDLNDNNTKSNKETIPSQQPPPFNDHSMSNTPTGTLPIQDPTPFEHLSHHPSNGQEENTPISDHDLNISSLMAPISPQIPIDRHTSSTLAPSVDETDLIGNSEDISPTPSHRPSTNKNFVEEPNSHPFHEPHSLSQPPTVQSNGENTADMMDLSFPSSTPLDGNLHSQTPHVHPISPPSQHHQQTPILIEQPHQINPLSLPSATQVSQSSPNTSLSPTIPQTDTLTVTDIAPQPQHSITHLPDSAHPPGDASMVIVLHEHSQDLPAQPQTPPQPTTISETSFQSQPRRKFKPQAQLDETDDLDAALDLYFSSILPSYNLPHPPKPVKPSVQDQSSIYSSFPGSINRSIVQNKREIGHLNNQLTSLDGHYYESITLIETELIRAKMTIDSLQDQSPNTSPLLTSANINLLESSELNKVYKKSITKAQGHYLAHVNRQANINQHLLQLEAKLVDDMLYIPTQLPPLHPTNSTTTSSSSTPVSQRSQVSTISTTVPTTVTTTINPTIVNTTSNADQFFSHFQSLLQNYQFDLNKIALESYERYVLDLLSLHTDFISNDLTTSQTSEEGYIIYKEGHQSENSMIRQAPILLKALQQSIETQMKNVHNEVMVNQLNKYQALQHQNEQLLQHNQQLEQTVNRLTTKLAQQTPLTHSSQSTLSQNQVISQHHPQTNQQRRVQQDDDQLQDDLDLAHQQFLQSEQQHLNDQSRGGAPVYRLGTGSGDHGSRVVEKPPNADLEELSILAESQKAMISLLTNEIDDITQQLRAAKEEINNMKTKNGINIGNTTS